MPPLEKRQATPTGGDDGDTSDNERCNDEQPALHMERDRRPSVGSNDIRNAGRTPRSPTSKEEILSQVAKKKRMSAAESKRMKILESLPWTQRNGFQMAVGFVITVNAIFMGVETDHGEDLSDAFYIMEHLFAALFSLELFIRLRVEGWRLYFSEGGNFLDFFLVVLSVADAWIITPLMGSQGMRQLSLLRLLRLLRLARVLRLFRIFKELAVIVSGFIASAKTLFWAGVFLIIIVYIFAIFGTERFGKSFEGECDSGRRLLSDLFDALPRFLKKAAKNQGSGDVEETEDPACAYTYQFHGNMDQFDYFGTVDRSMLTLYNCLTEGCGSDIIVPMTHETPWVMVYWYFFTFITSFGILNILIGLFCENVMTSAAESERSLQQSLEAARLERMKRLKGLFEAMDTDGSHSISREEFLVAIAENVEVIEVMHALNLDEEEDLFDKLDVNHSGELSFSEFFQGMMLIVQGSEPAKARDIVSTYLTSQQINLMVQEIHKIVIPGDERFENGANGADGSPQAHPNIPWRSHSEDEISAAKLHNDINQKLSALSERLQDHIVTSTIQRSNLETKIDAIGSKLDKLCDRLQQPARGRL